MNWQAAYYAVHGRKPPRRARRAWSPKKPKRDWRYRAWIRKMPSAVSGRMGCEAAHTGTDGGMGMKASDDTCIPLTAAEHREYHQIGKLAFERKYGLDCGELVKRLNAAYALARNASWRVA